MEKTEAKLYEVDEFESLEIERTSAGKYKAVFDELMEKLAGKGANMKYIVKVSMKIDERLQTGLANSEWAEGLIRSFLERKVKKGVVSKAFDGRIAVYKFPVEEEREQ